MDPHDLLRELTARLRTLVEDAVGTVVGDLVGLDPDPSAAGTVLAGRLLSVQDRLPTGNSLVDLLREAAGDLTDGSPLRLHGWRRAPGAPVGLALVLTDPADATAGRVALGITPGGPVLDLVATPGATVSMPTQVTGPWSAQARCAVPDGWDVSIGPGSPPLELSGTASVRFERSGRLAAGMADGPGLRVDGVVLVLGVAPGSPPSLELELHGLEVAVLPRPLAALLGVVASDPLGGGGPVTVTLRADRSGGLRFVGPGTAVLDLPVRLRGPGLRTRGVSLALSADGAGLRLGVSASLASDLPGLPLHVSLDGAGVDLPVSLAGTSPVGLDPGALRELFPTGIGTELALPPVSGGGVVRRTPDGTYAGLISVDLGFLRVQAIALFRPPVGTDPTSFLVLLSAGFPPPGLQLGLGFALDAVGGLVGVNRAVDVGVLQQIVGGGNADRILFPDDAVARAPEIVASLGAAFPVARSRMLVGPMVRITWGGRIVSLSGAVVLELPAPVRAVLVGRVVVSLPDPVAPLIRLQGTVLGRVDPSVPVVEVLISLAGSWIVGLAVRGEMYLLVRGGPQPVLVLSAGGFHPRYTRPPGVPALDRMQVDLAPGGGYGLRMEAYVAITSNAVMFGGQVQLDATIAGCGVQGWLGLDTLFVFDPVFAFSVHVRAGVAVRAFGHRLAGVGLDFTLEGPAPWHAFGTGSISVLFWDVDLDFDIRWGSPPAVATTGGRDPLVPLREALGRVEAWAAERPAAERTALRFTGTAVERLAAGTLVHPDATLRVSQEVVPLGIPISRFERRPVPVQTWTIDTVTLGTPQPAQALGSLPGRFVPGEFADLTQDQQLSGPAFVSHAAGVRVGTDRVVLGPGHRVDDGYETGYEPKRPTKERSGWAGLFDLEAVLLLAAAERLQRWRPTEVAVQVRPPTLVVAAAADLRPLLTDVSLVDATSDAWAAVREQLDDPHQPVELLEAWELPS